MIRNLGSTAIAVFYCLSSVTVYGQIGGGGGFGGPSVMGRGQQAGQRGGESTRLRGFVALEGIYDSGLTTITPQGVSAATGAGGVETRWGAYGSKSLRRSAFGLDYQGDYRHYNNATLWNGSSQTLSLSYSAQPFRHASFDVSAIAGSTNRAYGVNTGGLNLGGTLSQLAQPTTSLFDVRTNYLGGTGSMTLIHSSRLSSNYTGSGFSVRRRNRLPGVTAVTGRADVSYRLGKRSTIGMDVSYYKFDYTNSFGDTNVIDPGLLFSSRVGRNFELGLRVGVMRIESFGVKQVSFSPEVAALLGSGQTSEIFYLRTHQASGGLQLTRRFKRGSVNATGQIAPNPGNGLLFASRQLMANVNGSWSLNRRTTFSAMGGTTRLRSVTSVAGAYEQYMFGGGISYKLTRSLDLISRVDRRVARIESIRGIGLNGTRFTAGIAFSPSDVPLQLW